MSFDLPSLSRLGGDDTSLRSLPGLDGDTDSCQCDPSFREPVGTGVDDRVVLSVDADDCPAATSRRAPCLPRDGRGDADGARRRRDPDAPRGPRANLCRAGRGVPDRRRAVPRADRVPRDAARGARDPRAYRGSAGGERPRGTTTEGIAAETGLAETVASAEETGDVLRAHAGPTIAATRASRRRRRRMRRSSTDGRSIPARPCDCTRERDRFGRTTSRPPRPGSTTRAVERPTPKTDCSMTQPAATGHQGERCGRSRRPVTPSRHWSTCFDDTRADTARSSTCSLTDDRVSDATLSAPAPSPRIRFGWSSTGSGVAPTSGCRRRAATLASRLRRTSGRGFSRASPTLDATIEAEAGRVRVAATTAPASDGLSFTFRRGDPDAWTLARLVDGGTITPAAAGLLSVAVKRGVTGLVRPRPRRGEDDRAWVPPLGAASRDAIDIDRGYAGAAGRRGDCGRARRDTQRFRVGDGAEPSPSEAVRTAALRLGGGAIVVGEVRGEEAAALYEAMRVGARRPARRSLGTIHGEDPAAVRERVVTDPASPHPRSLRPI